MLTKVTMGVMIGGEKTRMTLYAEGGISVERHVNGIGFVIWDDFPDNDVANALKDIARMATHSARVLADMASMDDLVASGGIVGAP